MVMIDTNTLTRPLTYELIWAARDHAWTWTDTHPQLLSMFTESTYTWISGGVYGKGSAHATTDCRIVKQAGYTIETGDMMERAWVTGRKSEHCAGEGCHWLEAPKAKVVNAIIEFERLLQPLYVADERTQRKHIVTAPTDDTALTSGELDALIAVVTEACSEPDAEPAMITVLDIITTQTARWKDLSANKEQLKAADPWEQSKKEAARMGWAELYGSPKQCQWAENIRYEMSVLDKYSEASDIFRVERSAAVWIALRKADPMNLDEEWRAMGQRTRERQMWEDRRDAELWRAHTGQRQRSSGAYYSNGY